jgi:transcriptional regulator with XRE-family HTH domain
MIGEEIRRRRQEKGWTGVQLAEKASVIKLAAALECEVADLYPKAPQTPLPLDLDAHPPGEAYFVPLEEGEEEDIVTLRIYVWRELENDDPLLQKVAKLIEQERSKAKAEAG